MTVRLNTPGRAQGSHIGSQGLQTGSHGLQATGSHGAQDAASHGLQNADEPAAVMYTCCDVRAVVAVGNSEPRRHQLDVLPPVDVQPTLTDAKKATAHNNANFFMIWSPR